jgi:hypothetical protein
MLCKRLPVALFATLALGALVYAQPHAPVVTMTVTLPDGRTERLTAPESGLARLTVSGIEYGFRPTILDSRPWTRIVVTIFKTATAAAPTEVLGEVELKTGGAALASPTTPSFRVAIASVAAPPERTS